MSEGMDLQIQTVVSNAPVSDHKMAEIKVATAQDDQLSTLRQVTTSGWPESHKKCSPTVAAYWNHRDEISEANGILLKGGKIIVPRALRAEMLSDRKIQAASKRCAVLAQDEQRNRDTCRILQHLPRATKLRPKGTYDLTPHSRETLAGDSHGPIHMESH